MCYDIKAQLHSQLRRAVRLGDPNAVDEIGRQLLPHTDLPLFHGSGFQFPRLLIYTQRSPVTPIAARWGLLPHWVRTAEEKRKLRAQTLNARWETLFDKPSFRTAARRSRCLIGIDGFYEHYHMKGRTYPYYIYRKDAEPIYLAGISETIEDPEDGEILSTFSIVTVRANALMSHIHNNPKALEPRMPLILQDPILEDRWLEGIEEERAPAFLEEVAQPLEDGLLTAHTVQRLRGKAYRGNVNDINEPFEYAELKGGPFFES